MFASASFFALIVMPSARAAISRTMSATSRSPCPGSRSRMNQAFSANRHASRNSGTPYRSQSVAHAAQVLERDGLARRRELFVIVTNTTGTSAARSASSASSAPRSMFPLNGCSFAGSRPSGITRSTASAPVNSTFARVVSKCVLFGTTLPGPADRGEQDLLGGAALVRRDHVREREQLLHGLEEPEPRGRAGVALVAVLDRRPLVPGHRAGPGVGEQVDQHVVGMQVEQVVAGRADRGLALSSAWSSCSGSTEWIRNGSMIVRNSGAVMPRAYPWPRELVRRSLTVSGLPCWMGAMLNAMLRPGRPPVLGRMVA